MSLLMGCHIEYCNNYRNNYNYDDDNDDDQSICVLLGSWFQHNKITKLAQITHSTQHTVLGDVKTARTAVHIIAFTFVVAVHHHCCSGFETSAIDTIADDAAQ